jgi:hypothetical protein
MAPFLLHDLDSSVPTKVGQLLRSLLNKVGRRLTTVLPPPTAPIEATIRLSSRPLETN